jgi:diguanylate cyclase (GGDEF)-like protein
MTVEMKKTSENLAYQAESKIDNHLRSSETDTRMIATLSAVNDIVKERYYFQNSESQKYIIDIFETLKQAKSEYQELYLLNARGEVVFSYAHDMLYNHLSDNEWVQHAFETSKEEDNDKTYFINKAGDGGRIFLFSPILENESIIGHVLTTQDFRVFDAISYSFSPSGNSRLIYLNDKNEALHNLNYLDSKLMDSKNSASENVWHNVSSITWDSYKLKTSFGHILLFKNAGNYFKNLEELKYKASYLVIPFVILFTLAIWTLITNMVLIPIKKIGIIAKEISKGNFGVTIYPTRLDEIGELHNVVGIMANNIQNNNKHIERLAYYDSLTNLHNKQYFMEKLQKQDMISSTDVLTVWVIDLKDFKQINNINGYKVGNDVIKEVAKRLQKSTHNFFLRHNLNEQDVMISRGDGDVFMISANLPNTRNLPAAFADFIQENISNKIFVEGDVFVISASIGWEQGGINGFEIFEKADMAMHYAKKQNIPCSRFIVKLLEKVKYNKNLSDNIKTALEVNEFTLYYQPKCSPSDCVNANEFEALIRWPTKDGFISPGMFIPFAEEVNLIEGIDYWVMENVIKDISAMEKAGWEDFVVSFNVSGKRLSDTHFVSKMHDAISKYAIKPQHMQVEITEHSLIDDIEKSIRCISAIKKRGIKIALDDFGTGHSSLGYLKDLSVDTLKIDRVFVFEANKDVSKQILLSHIISLAHELGMQVVAEGVETQNELTVLQSLNCDLIQGFLFHKPMTLNDVFSKFQPRCERMAS